MLFRSNDTATTEIYTNLNTLSLHDALPIYLPNELLSAVYMFADDTKMFREMKDNSDHNILQSDLHRLNQWAKDWMLSFHPGKSSVLHLGKTNPQNKTISYK